LILFTNLMANPSAATLRNLPTTLPPPFPANVSLSAYVWANKMPTIGQRNVSNLMVSFEFLNLTPDEQQQSTVSEVWLVHADRVLKGVKRLTQNTADIQGQESLPANATVLVVVGGDNFRIRSVDEYPVNAVF
jgi:hypothetical protein